MRTGNSFSNFQNDNKADQDLRRVGISDRGDPEYSCVSEVLENNCRLKIGGFQNRESKMWNLENVCNASQHPDSCLDISALRDQAHQRC